MTRLVEPRALRRDARCRAAGRRRSRRHGPQVPNPPFGRLAAPISSAPSAFRPKPPPPPRRTGRRDGMRCEGRAANREAGTRQVARSDVRRSRHRELRHRRRDPLRRVRQSVSPDIPALCKLETFSTEAAHRSRTTRAASPPLHPAARTGTYVERMHHHSDVWNRVHECPNCARHVRLTREDRYRRHFATEPDGRLRLCPASGHAFAGVVAPGLHRLDL